MSDANSAAPLVDARAALRAFAEGRTSHVARAMPQEVMQLDGRTVLDALYRRLGPVLAQALDPQQRVASPVGDRQNGDWLKRSSCMGINLRTTGGLFGALKYVLTLPPHIDSIHLLPVFEPGVVGSLYGMASWRLNEEFFDDSWQRIVPAQKHVNDQLLAFVNICHALGKTVGLDVIPHTDRFSEIALANPWCFEWIQRDDQRVLDQYADLHLRVMTEIVGYYWDKTDDQARFDFFGMPEDERLIIMFGQGDFFARNAQRDELIQLLYERGFETLPATMAPPYRGLELDDGKDAVTVDARGRRWREFRFSEPQEMSRVFGPLARYKIWGRLNDNKDWAIDHERPRWPVFDYVAKHYQQVVTHFGFDFMRGDMSHVQTREAGVPQDVQEPYDLLRYVKRACAKTLPHFAYFAESFLTADNYMTYGSEAEHLNASEADAALGNLQNLAPSDAEFVPLLAEYVSVAKDAEFAPAFTLFSADKDDPRFDRFFNTGSLARYFFATFCSALPSYNSLGFRVRDVHDAAAPNECYTKMYVFHYSHGPKARHGPYRFGENTELFTACCDIDECAKNLTIPEDATLAWLQPPTVAADPSVISWQRGDLVFCVNFSASEAEISEATLTVDASELLHQFPANSDASSTTLPAGGSAIFRLNS